MKLYRIDTKKIHDEVSFHAVFAQALGFPAFYGNNWDAWIDCMSSLDQPEAGMSRVHAEPGDLFCLEILGTESFQKRCPKVFSDFVECTAFVNSRRTESGEAAILALVLT